MSTCKRSPKNGWHLWVPSTSQRIGKNLDVCYWCGQVKDQEGGGNPEVTRIPDEAINAGIRALHQHAALYDNECECGEGLSWDAYQAHKVQKIVEAALPYVKEDQ